MKIIRIYSLEFQVAIRLFAILVAVANAGIIPGSTVVAYSARAVVAPDTPFVAAHAAPVFAHSTYASHASPFAYTAPVGHAAPFAYAAAPYGHAW